MLKIVAQAENDSVLIKVEGDADSVSHKVTITDIQHRFLS